jgi:hypothetical protein
MTTPAERFNASPRPLLFIRIRLYRGGQAEFVRDLLRDEQADLMDELTEFRKAGKPEDDPEIEEVKQQLVWIINALRDIDTGLIELAGPDEDPR